MRWVLLLCLVGAVQAFDLASSELSFGGGVNDIDSVEVTCTAGAVPSESGEECMICGEGTYAGVDDCEDCPVGYWSEEGAESCTACPEGQVTIAKGSTREECHSLCHVPVITNAETVDPMMGSNLDFGASVSVKCESGYQYDNQNYYIHQCQAVNTFCRRITTTLSTSSVISGQSVQLECEAETASEPTKCGWMKDGQIVDHDGYWSEKISTVYSVNGMHYCRYTIDKVSEIHGGQYRCILEVDGVLENSIDHKTLKVIPCTVNCETEDKEEGSHSMMSEPGKLLILLAALPVMCLI